MSWQGRGCAGVHPADLSTAYVDDHLVGTGKITKAAILGKQGGVWAASAGYDISAAEQKAITTQYFTSPDVPQANGIVVAGFKFMTIQATPDAVIGRKGEKGIFIIPTTQAILIAEYDSPIPAGDANIIATKLAEYLKGVGY
ncbi:profilin, partial [Tremellales sp. Uapishka_1]